MPTQIVYTSFDRFPSPKGAATHIAAFVAALGRQFGNVDLVTIPGIESLDLGVVKGSAGADIREIGEWSAEGVTHHLVPAEGEHLFERVVSFRSHFWRWWRQRFGRHGVKVPIVQFRSIFEGYPIARDKDAYCRRIVYEVNGLPSIELKYHYPQVADDHELLRKLRNQEEECLNAADLVLTVSRVNQEHLVGRGVAPAKIRVIPNGVDLETFSYQVPIQTANSPLRVLYAGTMTAWQGVSLAIEAVERYLRDAPATLTLLGPVRSKERKSLEQQIWKAGISDHVTFAGPRSQSELAAAYHESDVVVAPLTHNDRNVEQGCCPLKVLEAMASGTPLVASNLPVVTELVGQDADALLVRAGSAKAIKDALVRIRENPHEARLRSAAARRRVEREFSWSRAQEALVSAYESLKPA